MVISMAMRSAVDHTMLGGGCKNSNCRYVIDYDYYIVLHVHLRTHNVTLVHMILV